MTNRQRELRDREIAIWDLAIRYAPTGAFAQAMRGKRTPSEKGENYATPPGAVAQFIREMQGAVE